MTSSLVGSEMCIRDSGQKTEGWKTHERSRNDRRFLGEACCVPAPVTSRLCLLYTSDAADDM
eukprot:2134714-Prorocentrum_lima.AAC.1